MFTIYVQYISIYIVNKILEYWINILNITKYRIIIILTVNGFVSCTWLFIISDNAI